MYVERNVVQSDNEMRILRKSYRIMIIVEVRVTRAFERQYKKLTSSVKTSAKEREVIFRHNPFDIRLATHKLHGKEKEIWSFSVTNSYRIKFIFLTNRSVLFLEIGTHDIYK